MREGKMNNKAEVTKQQKCIHHWIIDTADGHTSYGSCRLCGAVAEFCNNWIDGFVRIKRPQDNPPIQYVE